MRRPRSTPDPFSQRDAVRCAALAFAAALAACPGPEQATSVKLAVEYEASWGLDSLEVKARGKAFDVDVAHELELRFPESWAGEAVLVEVRGYHARELWARGEVEVVPRAGEQVRATVVLAWLGDEPPDLDAGPVDGAGDAAPRPDAGVDSAGADTASPDAASPDRVQPDATPPDTASPDRVQPDATPPDTASPDAAQPCDSCPDGGSCNEAGLCVEEDEHGVRWVSIPAGSFEMGCSVGDTECNDAELPRHTVQVAAFEMMETEVTQRHYLAVIGENPSYFSSGGDGADCGLDCPVERILWDEAKAFCETTGGRLPSEAEWEYAARAGTSTRYSCGDDEACLDAVAWYFDNSGDSTHPVATKDANAFGLYDMHGNVWEWVEDCPHASYQGAPATGGVWSGGDCTDRVLRGGSWPYVIWHQRVSHRTWSSPGFWYSAFGGRCVR